MRNPPPEEEGAAGTKCDEQTSSPIPFHPVLLLGEKAEKLAVKFSPGRREVGGRWFKIWFLFSHYRALT